MSGNFLFGRFEVRPAERLLLASGEPVRLGGRAFDILLALIERRDRMVGIDELLELVWPGLVIEENNLSVQISTLRKVLGPQVITTVRGRGYQFTAVLHDLAAPSQAPAAAGGGFPQWSATVVLVWFRRGGLAPQARPAMTEALLTRMLGSSGRQLPPRGPHLAFAFDQVREGVRAAWVALQDREVLHRDDRFGLAMVRQGHDATHDVTAAADSAMQLAAIADPSEVLSTADVTTELVSGVDADVEDVGELLLRGMPVRVFRLAPPGGDSSLSIARDLERRDTRPSIAVLPLEGWQGSQVNDMLGEALADEVIAKLSSMPGLCVISGLSSRRLRRCGLSMPSMASCLSAHFLLSGTFVTAGDRLVLHLQLQDGRHGAVLCSLRQETTITAAFDPEGSFAHAAAQEVAAAILQHSVERSRTTALPELENYALLMGAIGLLHRISARDFERARGMLEHLARRPGCFGAASAWLAKWHVLRVVQGWSPDPGQDARAALDLVRRALDDGSRDALALAIGGLVHAYLLKDLRTAGTLYAEALDANPSEPLAWLFNATRLAWLGQGPAAEEAGEHALRLSPIDPVKSFLDSLAATAMLANANWDRAVALSRQSIRANRMHASTWRTLAFALVMLDRMAEAREAVQQLLAIEPGFTVARFRERFPGRDGPLADPWAQALQLAGLPA